jgi:hypothetical protein
MSDVLLSVLSLKGPLAQFSFPAPAHLFLFFSETKPTDLLLSEIGFIYIHMDNDDDDDGYNVYFSALFITEMSGLLGKVLSASQ